jgi:hypothetical protein
MLTTVSIADTKSDSESEIIDIRLMIFSQLASVPGEKLPAIPLAAIAMRNNNTNCRIYFFVCDRPNCSDSVLKIFRRLRDLCMVIID